MKKTTCIVLVLIGCLLAFTGAGCKRKTASERPQTLEQGVEQLRAALVTASPAVQSNLYNGVSYGIRYGKYSDSLAALDRIASDPGLNDTQKKSVSAVIELLKQTMQNQQNAPKPTQ
jgi:hypothetical protein